VPFFQFHIYTNASGAENALISRARYIATGRGPELQHRDAGSLYREFRSSHIHHGVLVFFFIALPAIHLWRSPAFLWSFFPLLQILSAIYVLFLMNRGGTPLDVSLENWWSLWLRDVRHFFALDNPEIFPQEGGGSGIIGNAGSIDSFYPGDLDVWKARELLIAITEAKNPDEAPYGPFRKITAFNSHAVARMSAADILDFFNSQLINDLAERENKNRQFRDNIFKWEAEHANTTSEPAASVVPSGWWGTLTTAFSRARNFVRHSFNAHVGRHWAPYGEAWHRFWSDLLEALGISVTDYERVRAMQIIIDAYPDVFNHGFINWSVRQYWRGMYRAVWPIIVIPTLLVGAYVAPSKPRIGENARRALLSLPLSALLLWFATFVFWMPIYPAVAALILLPYILMVKRMTAEEWHAFPHEVGGLYSDVWNVLQAIGRHSVQFLQGRPIAIWFTVMGLVALPTSLISLLVPWLFNPAMIFAGVISFGFIVTGRTSLGTWARRPASSERAPEVPRDDVGAEAIPEYRVEFMKAVAGRGASTAAANVANDLNGIQGYLALQSGRPLTVRTMTIIKDRLDRLIRAEAALDDVKDAKLLLVSRHVRGILAGLRPGVIVRMESYPWYVRARRLFKDRAARRRLEAGA